MASEIAYLHPCGTMAVPGPDFLFTETDLRNPASAYVSVIPTR
jgi:hypothetical protein